MEPNKRTRRAVVTHCSKCGDELTEANATRRTGSQVWRSHCDPCRARTRRALHDSAEDAQRIMLTRDVCDICRRPETAKRNGVVRLLNKDHDHITGEWRGLLCSRCNQALGMFNDNVELFKRAIEYLENPPGLVLMDDEPAEARQEWRKGPFAPQISNQL
jgi:hypothetical protein